MHNRSYDTFSLNKEKNLLPGPRKHAALKDRYVRKTCLFEHERRLQCSLA